MDSWFFCASFTTSIVKVITIINKEEFKMFNEDVLKDAMDDQETRDFRRLDRLYDRFLKCEEKGFQSKAKELYDQIKKLETEMGLRGAES